MRYLGPGGPLDVAFEDGEMRTIVTGPSLGRLEFEWGRLSSAESEAEHRLQRGVRGCVGDLGIVARQSGAFWRSVSITAGGTSWSLRRLVGRVIERSDGSVLTKFRGAARGRIESDATPIEAAVTTLAWAFFLEMVGPLSIRLPEGPDFG